jgi:hypothetical protein
MAKLDYKLVRCEVGPTHLINKVGYRVESLGMTFFEPTSNPEETWPKTGFAFAAMTYRLTLRPLNDKEKTRHESKRKQLPSATPAGAFNH